MSFSNPGPRQRMVVSAADMIRRRGVRAMSVRDLAEHSEAPLGSTYHYFPGGKAQVVTEAVQFAGQVVAGSLAKKLEGGPLEGLRALLDRWRRVMTSTDFQAGCPVLAVSVEGPPSGSDPASLRAAAQAFASWESLLCQSLVSYGVDPREAGQLSTLVFAAAEGAVAMCRAEGSPRALDNVTDQLQALVAAAIDKGHARA